MGLMDWSKSQFIEIIDWLDDSNDVLAWRFPVRKATAGSPVAGAAAWCSKSPI